VNQQQRGPLIIPPDLTRLSDGSLVEWIKDSADSTKIRFLVWKDGRESIQDSVTEHGQIFVPPLSNNNLVKAIRLPTGISPCGEPKDLIREISTVLSDHVDFPDEQYFLISAIVLSIWFPECLNIAPYLVISGPTGSGKTTLLRLLQCLCRRAILIGDISSAALYRLADSLRPTLLLDESEFDGTKENRDRQRFLRAGNTPGEYIARGDKLFDAYCPKIICTNQPIEDIALSTRAIHLSLLPSSRRVKPVDRFTLEQIAAENQSRLLAFRLKNLSLVRRSPALLEEIEKFSPKMRDIGRALAVPLLGEIQLESDLIQVLHEQDTDALSERSQDPTWWVVETLFDCCHRKTGEFCVGDLAEFVNDRRHFAGEGEKRLTSRRVGAILKTLGIKTKRLGSWGRGFEFDRQLSRKAHALARAFGITRLEITSWMAVKSGNGGPPCSLCAEFNLNAGLRFPSLPTTRRKRRPLFTSDQHEDEIDSPLTTPLSKGGNAP
jgi:energy-coupling factor transporter ATP-binding protein EcfA2